MTVSVVEQRHMRNSPDLGNDGVSTVPMSSSFNQNYNWDSQTLAGLGWDDTEKKLN